MLLPLFPQSEKTHRLIYFADADTGGTVEKPEEEKDETDEVKEWRKLRKKEKPEDLKARVGKQIEDRKNVELPFLVKRMEQVMEGGDVDEIAWIDEYFNSGKKYTFFDFNEGLKVIREQKTEASEAEPIKSTSEAILDKVVNLGDYLDTLPIGSDSDSQDMVNLAHQYNEKDKQETKKLWDAITEHKPDFSKSDWNELLRTDLDAENYDDALKQILGEEFCRNHPDQVKKIKEIHIEKVKAMDKFEGLLTSILEKVNTEYEEQRSRLVKIMDLENATGLPIKEGQEFEVVQEDGSTAIAKIKALKWENRLDAEVINEMKKQGEHIYDQLFIDVEIKSGSSTKTQEMSYRKFIEWANDHNQVNEYIHNKKALEKALELDLYQQQLEVGTKIEYKLKEGIELETIEAIDPDAKKIRLTNQEMSFGEFAKWWRRSGAEIQMNSEQAQSVLNKLPDALKRKHPEREDVNEQPIELKTGSKIQNGKDKFDTITEVDDDKIKLSTGEEMPLSQFVRLAKDLELEPYRESEEKDEKTTRDDEEKKKADEIEESESKEIEEEIEKEVKEEQEHEKTEDEMMLEHLKNRSKAKSPGILQDIWNNVTFLSGKDVYRIGEVAIDYFSRNNERDSKRRVGAVGSKLPGRLGREFQIMQEESEHEAVNKYKDGMGDLSDWGVLNRLHATNNIDETKATIMLLVERGRLRFDDVKMWRTLNRLLDQQTGASDFKINIATFKDNPNLAQDQVKKAMDVLWGENTGDNFYKETISKFNSEADSFNDEAATYENSFKGVNISGELHNMLVDHLEGKPVKPQRYYSFLKYIMAGGKGSLEDKFYYLFQGLYRTNERGETLIPSRLVATLSELTNQLPFLDFLARCEPINGKGNLPRDYLADVTRNIGLNMVHNEGKQNKRYNVTAVNRYIWQDALMHKTTHTRVSKGSRGAGNIDHDDAHFIIPLNTLGDMKNNVLGKSAGDRLNYTKDGYMNGVVGFNMLFAATAATGSKEEVEGKYRADKNFNTAEEVLKEMVPSYVFYMNGIMGRVQGRPSQGADFLHGRAGVDGKLTMKQHFDEMNKVMERIMKAYGFADEDIRMLLDYEDTDTGRDGYAERSQKITDFGKKFYAKLKSDDGGTRIVHIIREAARSGQLSGIAGLGQAMSKQKDFANYWRPGYSPAKSDEPADKMAMAA